MSARFLFTHGRLDPRGAKNELQSRGRKHLADYFTGAPPRTFEIDRTRVLFAMGSSAELEEAVEAARYAGISEFERGGGGRYDDALALWSFRARISVTYTATLLAVATDAFWGGAADRPQLGWRDSLARPGAWHLRLEDFLQYYIPEAKIRMPTAQAL
jgi:hypothetical protein